MYCRELLNNKVISSAMIPRVVLNGIQRSVLARDDLVVVNNDTMESLVGG